MDRELMELLATMIVGGVIVPVVALLKQTVIAKAVRPEFMKALLAMGAVWLLTLYFPPDPALTASELIRSALGVVGGGTLVYATKRLANGK